MKSIADALVYATTYINLKDAGDEDDDVGALESILSFISNASEKEKDALADAAKRAHEAETKSNGREEWISDYASWMEDMFGEDWQGNERAE